MFNASPTPRAKKHKDDAVFENSPAGIRPLWTVADVASYLKVSERTVRDWVFKQMMPYRKVGRCVRFDPAVIERWTLQNQE